MSTWRQRILLTAAEIAEVLEIDVVEVKNWARSGKLTRSPYTRQGHHGGRPALLYDVSQAWAIDKAQRLHSVSEWTPPEPDRTLGGS